MLQPIADATRVLLQWRRRFQPDGAVGAAIGYDLGRREQRLGIHATIGGSKGHRFPLAPSWVWGWRLLYARTARHGNASSRHPMADTGDPQGRCVARIALLIKWANSIRTTKPVRPERRREIHSSI
jgi:hypothetical protein